MTLPLYKSVIDKVIARITSGALSPGAMLPSETDLGLELGVSQGTARKALIELEQRGIVQRRQGRGTFVTVRTPESALFHFFRLRNLDGAQAIPSLEEEKVTRRKADKSEKDCLFGNPDYVFDITRSRSINSRRLIYETSVVPVDLFPGLLERTPLQNTLYVFYQQAYSCVIVRAEEKIRAAIAESIVADALDIVSGEPVLVVERLSYDMADRAVERRVSTLVTDSCTYDVTLS